jgi:S1-C subfamily serine protease
VEAKNLGRWGIPPQLLQSLRSFRMTFIGKPSCNRPLLGKGCDFHPRWQPAWGMLKRLAIGGLLVPALLALACGPSAEEIDQRVREILTAVPTPTPVLLPTPLPTATPAPTATPQPTATPLILSPTPTPIILPPTPTPITLPPVATPQPTATPQPINNLSGVYRATWRSAFLIDTPSRGGSGWLVEPGLILTNDHVLGRYSSVTVRQALDPPFTATVLGRDSRWDIALLRFDPEEVRLPPNAQPLSLGQISNNHIAHALIALGYSSVEVFGNRTAGPAGANVGVLSQITDFGSGSFGRNLVMDVPVDPEDSGGPVLNDRGEVVGMVRAVQEQTNSGQRVVGTFYAVHVDEIRAALPALKRGESR